MRQKLKSGDEYDVVTGWYKVMTRFQRSGVRNAVKTRLRRRRRHEAKHAIRKDRDDG